MDKQWDGEKANVLLSSFALHLHITTSDWPISDDCANVVWHFKINFKWNIILLFDIDSWFGNILHVTNVTPVLKLYHIFVPESTLLLGSE